MARKFDFELVRNAIEKALHSNDYSNLDIFEDILSAIIQKLRTILDNSIIPRRTDILKLNKIKVLYFLIISDKN